MTTVTLNSLENIEKGHFVVGSIFINAKSINTCTLKERLFEEKYLTTVWLQFTGGGSEVLENDLAIEFLNKFNQFLTRE